MTWIYRLIELTEDWRYLIRRDGLKSALPHIVKAIIVLPYRHIDYVGISCSLQDPIPELKPKTDLKIQAFKPVHLDFVRTEYLPSEANLCAQRIKLNHYGFVAIHQGQITGYGWGCTDTSLERVELNLTNGDVLCTDAFTAKSFRGKGVQTALSLARLRFFKDLGFKRAIVYIEKQNYPSLAVWRKVGGRVVCAFEFKRIGFKRRTRIVDILTTDEEIPINRISS